MGTTVTDFNTAVAPPVTLSQHSEGHPFTDRGLDLLGLCYQYKADAAQQERSGVIWL